MLTRRSGFGRRCATHARDLIASSIRLGVGLTRFSSHLSASSSVDQLRETAATVAAADDLSWAVFHYSGAAAVVGDGGRARRKLFRGRGVVLGLG